MNTSRRVVSVTTSLVLALAGCSGMVLPRGIPGMPGASTGAGQSASAGAASAQPASENNCIGATECVFDASCPEGQRCNRSMNRCFDPEPVAANLLTCNLNACVWDTDCPTEWHCNTAVYRCELR